MLKNVYIIVIICLFALTAGCATVTETGKVIWGSSTRALEDARVEAIVKTYKCSFNDCFDAVLSLSRSAQKEMAEQAESEETAESEKIEKKDYFDVFIKNRKKRFIVVMGIKGNVDTTEVGIFFSQPTLTTVKIEISSLSSSAKRKVAEFVFEELSLRFSEAK